MAEPINDLSLAHLLGEKFHPLQPKLILAGEFEVAAVGGMGAGKTYAACAAAFRHAAKWPGARVLVARFTYDEMVKSTKWAFYEFVKNKGLQKYFAKPKEWDYREGTHYCRLTNGSEIMFSNLDRNLDKHKNVEYSYVFIDQLEEISFDVYQLLLLRCRLSVCPAEERHVIGVANDEGDNWIRHRFLTYEQPHGRPTARAGRLLIRGTSLDNPHLDEGARAQYLALPPELQERWVFATMRAGSTRLLPPLTEIDAFDVPRHWPRWLGVDPARSTGVTCGEWVTANPDKVPYRGVVPNGIHFYQEYWGESRDVEEHAKDIQLKTGLHRLRGQVMDKTAWAVTISSKKVGQLSVGMLYNKAGLQVGPSSGDEWARVSLYIAAARRGLTVAKGQCPNLVKQGPNYRVKGQMGPFGPIKIEAKAKFHSVDAGGYALELLPTNAVGVEIRSVKDWIDVGEHVDEGSRQHWARENEQLPKRRGRDSLITMGMDEDEFHREEREYDPAPRKDGEDLW